MKADTTITVDGSVVATAGLYDDDTDGGVCVALTDASDGGVRLVLAGGRPALRRALRAATEALDTYLAGETSR